MPPENTDYYVSVVTDDEREEVLRRAREAMERIQRRNAECLGAVEIGADCTPAPDCTPQPVTHSEPALPFGRMPCIGCENFDCPSNAECVEYREWSNVIDNYGHSELEARFPVLAGTYPCRECPPPNPCATALNSGDYDPPACERWRSWLLRVDALMGAESTNEQVPPIPQRIQAVSQQIQSSLDQMVYVGTLGNEPAMAPLPVYIEEGAADTAESTSPCVGCTQASCENPIRCNPYLEWLVTTPALASMCPPCPCVGCAAACTDRSGCEAYAIWRNEIQAIAAQPTVSESQQPPQQCQPQTQTVRRLRRQFQGNHRALVRPACICEDCQGIREGYGLPRTVSPDWEAPDTFFEVVEEQHVTTCPSCGQRRDTRYDAVTHVPQDEIRGIQERGIYCRDCTAQCAGCGNRLPISVLEPAGRYYYCRACLVECGECGTAIRRGGSFRNPAGDSVCNDCVVRWPMCPGCNNHRHPEEMQTMGNRELCRHCLNEYYRQPILRAHYRPGWTTRGTDIYITDLFMGIELEVEAHGDNDIEHDAEELLSTFSEGKSLFYVKRDGSLRHGFEIVTHPCSLSFHAKQFPWYQVSKWLLQRGYRSHKAGTCGLHVHISRAPFTSTDEIKIGHFVNNQRWVMTRLARRTTNFGKYVTKLDKPHLEDRYSDERYEAVNFTNNDTIEFRLFRGTLRHATIMATLQAVHALARFAKANSVMLFNDKAKSRAAFLQFIKDEGKLYAELREYCNTRRIMGKRSLAKQIEEN